MKKVKLLTTALAIASVTMFSANVMAQTPPATPTCTLPTPKALKDCSAITDAKKKCKCDAENAFTTEKNSLKATKKQAMCDYRNNMKAAREAKKAAKNSCSSTSS